MGVRPASTGDKMRGMGSALLERAAELETLRRATDAAADGRSSLVLVLGEAGIGKTSLVQVFLKSVVRPQVRVLQGACDDLLTPRTFGPLRDAAAGTGGALAAALKGEPEPEAVYQALLIELAERPTVLVLEDVHWADDATIDALRHLARRLDRCRAVVVLSYREDEITLDHPLRRVLGALAGAHVERLALRPLSRAAVAELAAATGSDLDEVYEITGGNPFFVTEALAAGAGVVPTTVVDAVISRLQLLPGATRKALEQLAVVPSHVEWWLAETLLDDLTCVSEAEQHGILRARSDGLAFRHELARRAVESTLPATRRLMLNRAVVDALLARPGADLSRVVHHAVQAGDVQTVLSRGPAAAREAARAGSHRQALSHYEQVVAYADRMPDEARARILIEYGWELYAAHRYAQARSVAAETVRLCERLGDPVMLGEALVALSRYSYMVARPVDALAAAERAVAVLEPTGDRSGLAYARTYHGALLSLTDRHEEALPELDVARDLAAQEARTDLVALGYNYIGTVRVEMGDAAGIADLRRSLALARDIDHHEYIARAYTNLAESLHHLRNYAALADCVTEGLAYAREHDMQGHAYNLRAHQAMVDLAAGRWPQAEATLRELTAETQERGALARNTVQVLGRLLARKGDPEARNVLDEGWRIGCRAASLQAVAPAGLAIIEWAWLAGDLTRAQEQIEVLLERTTARFGTHYRAELLRYLARARHPAAANLDDEVLDALPAQWAFGLRGDWRAAATTWDQLGDVYEAALERGLSGDREAMVAGLEVLDRLGADATATVVRRRLRELGVVRLPRGPLETTRANPAGLTERQVDVLALLAEGLTNAEIAERLVVSPRTVDHHVSAILAKLGVATRREAGRAAADLLGSVEARPVRT